MNDKIIAKQRREAGDPRATRHVGRLASAVITIMLISVGLGALAQRTFLDTGQGSGTVKSVPAHQNAGFVHGRLNANEPIVPCSSTPPTKVITVRYQVGTVQCAQLLLRVKARHSQPPNTLRSVRHQLN
jgi:hypothetical protein